MKKIMLVFGTRPEAIKMAPLYHALKSREDIFITQVCVTAQHRHMLDQVLEVFDIKVEFDLNIMRENQDLFDVTSGVLLGMREVLRVFRPDVLLVHGDTTTTLASSIAAFYLGIPVGHIEAGLRTHNLLAPFPEEFNRQICSKVAKWHFAPTALSRQSLLDEGVLENQVVITGNTVIDSLFMILNRIESTQSRKTWITEYLNACLDFSWEKERFILITGHRRESFGDGFMQICSALKELALKYPSMYFVYPVHLNPSVQQPVKSILKGQSNIFLINPLEYEVFVYLLKYCYLVLTDSGGIQEEAPSLGKPVLVMRDLTERPEGVEAGVVKLVGANCMRIVASVSELIDDEDAYKIMALSRNPYGDGKACAKIIEVLRKI
jgi:UDP-N-acetylglucosamine 2-epimerase (non-hydrolysing)